MTNSKVYGQSVGTTEVVDGGNTYVVLKVDADGRLYLVPDQQLTVVGGVTASFDGRIGPLAAFDRPLNRSQRQALYANPRWHWGMA